MTTQPFNPIPYIVMAGIGGCLLIWYIAYHLGT